MDTILQKFVIQQHPVYHNTQLMCAKLLDIKVNILNTNNVLACIANSAVYNLMYSLQ